MPTSFEYPTFPGAQRHHVTRTREVCRADVRIGKGADRPCPIGRADAGRDTDGRVDAHGESRAEGVGRIIDHRRKFELGQTVRGHRHTQESGGVFEEEGDVVDVGELSGHHEVGFVLAVGVVDDDDRTAEAELIDAPLDRGTGRTHLVVGDHR